MTDVNYTFPEINCPHCGAKDVLTHALNSKIITSLIEQVNETAKRDYDEKLSSEKNQLAHQARIEAQKLTSDQVKGMSSELENLLTEKTDLEINLAKMEATNASMKQSMETKIAIATTAALEKAKVDYELTNREYVEEINRLQRSIETLKSNSNSRSSQLTGEAGETLIEDRLRQLFPRDLIEEIKKGQNGADCLWTVRNNGGGSICKIYFESKVTQTFQSAWVSKLKSDMVDKNADIGIIVTKTMPAELQSCTLKSGVWIVPFHEFETLAKALRQGQIDLNRALLQESTRDDKSNELFDFIVGKEFSSIMEKILSPIFEQQQLLDKEKRSLTRIWKAREKHIEASVNGAGLLAGQLETILGAAVVNQIGFEQFEMLELLEEEPCDPDCLKTGQ